MTKGERLESLILNSRYKNLSQFSKASGVPSKRFTAVFFDEENKKIYEIDGNNHREYLQTLKDGIRNYFFWHELGIRTFRITNEKVEKIVIERLEELYKEGVIK